MKFRLQGITHLSTNDWPGKLAAVIFLQGCDLRCPWCQNVDGVDPKGGLEASTEEVIKRIEELKPMIDSVVLTGGEPLLQPTVCFEFLKSFKELELGCAIETNASKPKALKRILPYLDFIAIDYKAPLGNPELYAKVVGIIDTAELVEKIGESVTLALNSDAEVEARTTVAPTLTESEEVIAWISEEVKKIDRLCLQQFRNQRTLDPEYQKLPSPSRERLLELAAIAKRKGIKKVRISTVEGGLEEV